MANNGTIPPGAILNPYTTLAFMPPDIADQFQVMCYVYVATLAAYTWDWLMSMPEEYRIIRKVGFKLPNIAYFVSRFSTLGSCVSTVIFRIAPIDDCAVLKYVEGTFFAISLPATSLLFLFRVKAVYNDSRIVTTFFGILWLAIAGVSILIMLGITGNRIPYTRRCTEGLAHKYTTVPIFLTAVNDTLVFIAITGRLLSSSMVGNTWSAKAKSFFRGDGLHQLSRALLQSGQAYYFATIGVAIIAIALILSPSIPAPLHPILGSSYHALASAMACRVFRGVLLGLIEDPQLKTTRIRSFYRTANNNRRGHADDGDTTKQDTSGRLSKLEINVAVEMDTKAESYEGDTFEARKLDGDYVRQDASHLV